MKKLETFDFLQYNTEKFMLDPDLKMLRSHIPIVHKNFFKYKIIDILNNINDDCDPYLTISTVHILDYIISRNKVSFVFSAGSDEDCVGTFEIKYCVKDTNTVKEPLSYNIELSKVGKAYKKISPHLNNRNFRLSININSHFIVTSYKTEFRFDMDSHEYDDRSLNILYEHTSYSLYRKVSLYDEEGKLSKFKNKITMDIQSLELETIFQELVKDAYYHSDMFFMIYDEFTMKDLFVIENIEQFLKELSDLYYKGMINDDFRDRKLLLTMATI